MKEQIFKLDVGGYNDSGNIYAPHEIQTNGDIIIHKSKAKFFPPDEELPDPAPYDGWTIISGSFD